MKLVKLKREGYQPGGTYGRLHWPGIDVPILTVERPWLSNRPFQSCIPEGVYVCRKRRYRPDDPKGYDAVEVCDVPGRTDILFHRGNWPTTDETTGCILVGLEPQERGGLRGVKDSRGAWVLLEAAGFLAEPFILEVTA